MLPDKRYCQGQCKFAHSNLNRRHLAHYDTNTEHVPRLMKRGEVSLTWYNKGERLLWQRGSPFVLELASNPVSERGTDECANGASDNSTNPGPNGRSHGLLDSFIRLHDLTSFHSTTLIHRRLGQPVASATRPLKRHPDRQPPAPHPVTPG